MSTKLLTRIQAGCLVLALGLYVTGEYFYPGDPIRVGGMLASNVAFITPTLLRAELPPGLPPGRCDVEILSAHTAKDREACAVEP